MKYLILTSLILFSINSQAASCKKLQQCVDTVAQMTNTHYITFEPLKGEVLLPKSFKIEKDTADDFLSEVLHANGYTRLKMASKNSYKIVNARDVRYMANQRILISGKDQIPTNHDYMMVKIQLKNKYMTSEITRNFRPFMSRYGRIIDLKNSGTLLVNETGKNVHRLLQLLDGLDKAPSKEEIAQYKADKKRREQIQMIKASKCSEKN